jgi:hypothetical protein
LVPILLLLEQKKKKDFVRKWLESKRNERGGCKVAMKGWEDTDWHPTGDRGMGNTK